MRILVAKPRGFCAGVERAIEIVNRALELFGAPIYVRHEIVHNHHVVTKLRSKGAVFVDTLDAIPNPKEGEAAPIVIFSAHGVSQSVRKAAQNNNLRVFDATCPLVTKVHLEVLRYIGSGCDCILIGHAGHPEVIGTLGQRQACSNDAPQGRVMLIESVADIASLKVRDPNQLGYVTQTTLSMDDTAEIINALKQRFPSISAPKKDDICYATQNRQNAVHQLAPQCDAFVVVGSTNSSNSNRLRETAASYRIPAYLVDSAAGLKQEWFRDRQCVGLTAGASAPETLVQKVIQKLQAWGDRSVYNVTTRHENVVFSLPQGLAVKFKARCATRDA